jgi:hypothetical protein
MFMNQSPSRPIRHKDGGVIGHSSPPHIEDQPDFRAIALNFSGTAR